jgi:multiple sugar transport system permease protein
VIDRVGEGTVRSLPAVRPARPAGCWRRSVPFVLALAPAATLLGLFFVWPVAWAIYSSLTDLSLESFVSAGQRFVGFDNYRRLLRDQDFRLVVENTVVYVGGAAVVGQFGLGFGLALLLDHARARGYRVWAGAAQVSVLVAWICPLALAGFIWVGMLHPIDGTLNAALAALGLGEVDWLARYPMASVIVAEIWRGTAFAMVVFLGGLRTVPRDIHEAARVDGASAWQRFRDHTLPNVRPFAALALLMSTVTTLGSFILIEVLTGGAGMQTTTLAYYAYRNGFGRLEIGYGSAVVVVMLAFSLAVVLACLALARGRR